MMDFGYFQAALQENNKKRNEKIIFEWGYYMTFCLQNGEFTRINIGQRGHKKFKPTLRQKLKLIIRILFT